MGHPELHSGLSERNSAALPEQAQPLPCAEHLLSTPCSPGKNEDYHWQSASSAVALDQFQVAKHMKST